MSEEQRTLHAAALAIGWIRDALARHEGGLFGYWTIEGNPRNASHEDACFVRARLVLERELK